MSIFERKKILFKKTTKFNHIKVIRKGNIITLWCDDKKQTEIQLDNPLHTCLEYSQNCLLALAFHPDPRSILVLGLGGGAVPSILHHILEKAIIDVVEIDPEMHTVAKKYFHFSLSERLRLFINDAFFFIRDTNNNYDIVIMDAYIGNQLPQSVDNMAFLVEAARILNPKGLFVANLMTADEKHFKNMIKRISKIFKNIWLLPGVRSTNTLVFAARENILPSEIQKRAEWLYQKIPFESRNHTIMNQLEDETIS
ncbi:MAG: fused MFS/spermidine synthase [Candidatus Aminicenantes bacterium]|nr:MAG: fused MFS/spermidine synthase [Candidatus Aminicenantes bacterium]